MRPWRPYERKGVGRSKSLPPGAAPEGSGLLLLSVSADEGPPLSRYLSLSAILYCFLHHLIVLS